MTKTLFILKRYVAYTYSAYENPYTNPDYSGPGYSGSGYSGSGYSYHYASGLWYSAQYMVQVLRAAGRQAQVVTVEDADSIDNVVTMYDATHVFIEGIWVTPDKFRELLAISSHKTRLWHVRLHSEVPFIASEGMAMDWISEYLTLGVRVAPNAPRLLQQLTWQAKNLVADVPAPVETLLPYIPNCYPVEEFRRVEPIDPNKATIDIACFGAFRPLKNNLQQAFVALRFAQAIDKTLRFHINSKEDVSGSGSSRNVKDLFDSVGAELIFHDWEDRPEFLQSLSTCDLLLQISMSETFNFVAADAVLVGIPTLTSSEVPWVYPVGPDPQTVDDCLEKLHLVWNSKEFFIVKNRLGLTRYAEESARRLLAYIPM